MARRNDPADDFLRADAAARGMTITEYERAFGIMLADGPAENRTKYHELTAGALGQDDLSRAADRERRYTPERNRKRRRGYHPDGDALSSR
jgi:hypothetical protein